MLCSGVKERQAGMGRGSRLGTPQRALTTSYTLEKTFSIRVVQLCMYDSQYSLKQKSLKCYPVDVREV